MRICVRNKILLSFLTVFFLALLTLGYFTYYQMQNTNAQIIKQQMTSEKEKLDLYIQNYMNNTGVTPSADTFVDNCNYWINQLSMFTQYRLALYNNKGILLCDTNPYGKRLTVRNKDFIYVLNGDYYVSIVENDNNHYANLYYPVTENGKTISVIVYSKNFTPLYKSSDKFLSMLVVFAIFIFALISFFSYIISKNITTPLIKLSDASEQISHGNFDLNFEVKSNDEIGDLAKSFNNMNKKIKSQIELIERDRDTLKELEEYRKKFLDNVTHELKTPLTIISGYAQVIKSSKFEDISLIEEGINHIESESNRLYRLVTELLELSEATSNHMGKRFEKINISEIITALCTEMNIKASHYKMYLECNLDENIFVFGDSDNLKECFINVIDNAIKYGTIGTNISINYTKDEQNVYFIIKNKGKGIDKDKIEDIFKPFFRVDRQKSRSLGSNGLGLAITKSIIESHHGEINIESIKNDVTTVTLKIPLFVYNSETSC